MIGNEETVGYLYFFIIINLLFFIILLVAIIVKTQIGSPILFRQQRPGLHGKPFYLYKFRTMTNERDNSGSSYQITLD